MLWECCTQYASKSGQLIHAHGFPYGSTDKESVCNVGDLGLIPGLGRSPGGGHGNPLQYSCLGNLQGMHSSWGRKELDTTEQLSLHSPWPQYWKRSGFIPIPKKGNAKEVSNYCTIALISHASKVILKILQARLQQYMNQELPHVQAGFRKGRRTRDQIANIRWIIVKARGF